MDEWVMIGVPTSAGAHHAGQELAPDALRAAGLADRLLKAGLTVTDAGNWPERYSLRAATRRPRVTWLPSPGWRPMSPTRWPGL